MDYEPRLHRERDSAEYQRVHKWVYKTLGKADFCENDKSHISGRYHWANLSHKYKLDINDWKKLCPRCHRKQDIDSPRIKAVSTTMRVKSAGNGNRNQPVIMIYPEGHWIRFGSAREANACTGILFSAISNVLTGRARTAGGYRWRRV